MRVLFYWGISVARFKRTVAAAAHDFGTLSGDCLHVLQTTATLHALAATVQGALLIGLTLLLVMPAHVPDPLAAGAGLSCCLLASLPTLAYAVTRRLPATRVDPLLWVYVACCLVVLPFSHDLVVSGVWLLALAANISVFYGVVLAARRSHWLPPPSSWRWCWALRYFRRSRSNTMSSVA